MIYEWIMGNENQETVYCEAIGRKIDVRFILGKEIVWKGATCGYMDKEKGFCNYNKNSCEIVEGFQKHCKSIDKI